jgi:apolipoprotein N-acyltransferase
MKNKLSLFSALGALAVSALSGWAMADRYSKDELWGHLPLFFFAGLWIAILGIVLNRRKASALHTRWTFLTVLSGVLLTMGFPPFPSTFTLFIGLVPLLFAEREIENSSAVKSPLRTSIFYAYTAFVTWNMLSTWWVANTALAAGAFAIFANAGLMLIPFTAFLLFKKYVGPRTAYWTLTVFWLCFEYGHMRWEITWPWLTLGNALSQFAWLPQWYSFTGALGGSLWILMSNVFFFQIFTKKLNLGIWSRGALLAWSLFILLPVGISVGMYFSHKEDGEIRKALIIQPNYEPHYQKFSVPEYDQVLRISGLIYPNLNQSIDYIVLPETTFDYVDLDAIHTHPSLETIQTFLKPLPETRIIIGVSAHRFFDQKPFGRHSVRTSNRNGQTYYWESYNSALQLGSAKNDVQVYHKSKLVPGPEIFPYRDQLFFLKPLVDKLDGTIEGLGIQKTRTNLESPSGSIAPVICYESVFGEYVSEYVQNGAQAIAIMTNDGWWDNTAGFRQHLLFGRLRAIETRRSIVRAANSGVSAFINQRGDILQATEYGVPAAITGDIRMSNKITFYTTWGDIIGRLSLFIAGFQLLYLLFGLIKVRLNIR